MDRKTKDQLWTVVVYDLLQAHTRAFIIHAKDQDEANKDAKRICRRHEQVREVCPV